MKNASEVGGLIAACEFTGGLSVMVRQGFADSECFSFVGGVIDAPEWMAGGSVVKSTSRYVMHPYHQSFSRRGV